MFSSINPKSGDHFVISDNSPAAFGRMIGAEFDCLRDILVQLPDCPPMNHCFLIKSDNVPAALETAEKLITSIRRTAQPVFIEKLLGDIAGVQPNRYPVCSDERISRLQDMADHKEMPMIFTAGADTGFEKYNNCGIAAAIMAPEVCTYTDDSAAATVIEACENNYILLDICRPTPENIRRNAFIKLRMAYSCTSEEKLGQLAGMIAEAVCSSDEYISGMIRNMRDADRLIGKELSRLGSADVCGDDDDEEEYYEEEYYEEAGEEDPFGDVFGDIPEITPMPTGFGGFFGGMPAGTNEHKKIPVKVQTIDELVDPGDKKEKLESIVNSLRLEMEMSGDGHMTDGYNVIFAGNPGCGKTTVARAFAKMLEEAGIVPENSFVELKKSDYVGMVVGETEKLIDSNYERHAAGAVFFYDEAYVLSSEQRTVFEQEAYDTILSNMENYRGRIINIFAGYKDLMNRFADCNAGMRSRISDIIVFEDYSDETLTKIFYSISETRKIAVEEGCEETVCGFFAEKKLLTGDRFGNGREARNLFSAAFRKLADRTAAERGKGISPVMIRDDIRKAADEILSADRSFAENGKEQHRIGFGG